MDCCSFWRWSRDWLQSSHCFPTLVSHRWFIVIPDSYRQQTLLELRALSTLGIPIVITQLLQVSCGFVAIVMVAGTLLALVVFKKLGLIKCRMVGIHAGIVNYS